MMSFDDVTIETVVDDSAVFFRRLMGQLDDLRNDFIPFDEGWTSEALGAMRMCRQGSESMSKGVLYILCLFQSFWKELPSSFTQQYSDQFYVFAQHEFGITTSKATLDNYVRAGQVFLVEGKKPFGSVEVSKRDERNRVVIEEGEIVTEYRDFDPAEVPISKLVLLAPHVERMNQDTKLWGMMMDSGTTVNEIQSALYHVDKPQLPDPSLKFELAADIIYASEYGISIEIGRIDFSAYNDGGLEQRAINKLMNCLGIKHDEEVIAYLLAKNGNGVNYETKTDQRTGHLCATEV